MPRTIKSNEDAAGQIRREALAAGASSITLCTQAYGELKKYITEQGQGGGICRSLSMAWLEGRKTGVNFLQKMLGPGGTIKVGEVLPMCQAYKAAGELSIDEQQALIIANLTAKGLASTGAEKLTQVGGGSNVSAWFTQNSAMSGLGQLRSVNVFGGYNHAMAMDISQQYAIFFDPNWGAFTFPTHLKMVAFLEKSMFVLSGGKFHYADVKEFRNAMKICFL
jgi:hypothetical protein